MVMIHIVYRQDKNELQVGSNKNANIFYHEHPLEIGCVFTFCKVQSLTFDKVIFQLEQSK